MSKRRGFGFMNKKQTKSINEPVDNIMEEQSDYQEDELQYSGEQYDPDEYIPEQYDQPINSEQQYMEQQYAEGQYAEGQYAEQQYAQEQYTEEQYVEGQYTEEQYVEGQYTEEQYVQQQYENSAYVNPQYMNPRYSDDPSYADPNFSKTNYLPQLNIDESIEYQDEQGSFDGFSGRYGDYDEYGISDYMDDGFNEYDEYSEYDEDYEQYGDGYEDFDDSDAEPKKDIVSSINDWVAANKIICFTVLGAILVIAIVLFVIAKLKSGGEESVSSNSSNTASVNDVSGTYIPQDPLLINNYPEVNDIVNKYFTARQSFDMATINSLRDCEDPVESAKLEAMSYYVESYNDITCYTKPGPFENSYITYITYNVKLYEWEQVAPALITFLICTKDDGSLYIYSGELDQNVEEYIAAISAQEDVVDLITRINAEYKEVLDSDESLKDYMSEFNTQIREKVKERLAAIKMEEDAANPDNTPTEDEIKELVTFEVKATETVNVRASDSEDADRVGRVEAGTVLTCYEQRTNGWSQVEYEGEIAYIKSDFLVNLSSTRTSTDDDVIGTVKAKETVNIRDKDSTDGRQLGVAYVGDTFPLIEKQSNGWSKIIYNDMDAYIKTEYLE